MQLDRHRAVGRSAHLRRTRRAGRLVRGARSGRLPGILGRYRSRYGQDPLRPATLAYDAVSLVAALVKTQGPARFSEEMLTNAVRLRRHRRRVPLPPRRHQPARACGDARDDLGRAGRSARRRRRSAPAGPKPLRRQIRHHRIEHRETRARDAQAAVGVSFDHAFRAERSRCALRRADGPRRRRSAAGRCPRRAAAPSAGYSSACSARVSVSSSTRPWPFASTRISQDSGRFSVEVA